MAVSTGSAQIGETLGMCKQRYGEPYKSTEQAVYFRKLPFKIMVRFYQGKADCIVYLEENELGYGIIMSDSQIGQLLKLDGRGRNWKRREGISMDRQWETEDGQLSAFYKTFENYLTVATKGFYERAAAEKKAKKNKAVGGV
jgi:hypothetical protein